MEVLAVAESRVIQLCGCTLLVKSVVFKLEASSSGHGCMVKDKSNFPNQRVLLTEMDGLTHVGKYAVTTAPA